MSPPGPGLPTLGLAQVGSYLGYTGRAANVAAMAALVKVFRRRPSQTFPHGRGRRLKTSKGRNREKGHVLGGAARSLWGFRRGRATAELSSEGRLSGEAGDAGWGRCAVRMSGPVYR
jgi:hypothetical protein